MAENSRMEALGYNTMFHDPLAILDAPSNLLDYPNLIQGTANRDGFGTVLLTKSLGSSIVIGAYSRRLDKDSPSSVLAGEFYSDARDVLTKGAAGIDDDDLPDYFTPLPHLMGAVSFGNSMRLGVDFVYERRGISLNKKDKDDENLAENTLNASITNLGLKADVALTFGGIKFNPYVGFAFPSVHGEEKALVNGEVQNSTLIEKEEGSHLQIGTDANVHIGRYHVHGGFSFLGEKYQYRTTTDDGERAETEVTNPQKTRTINAFSGFSVQAPHDITVGVMYAFSYRYNQNVDKDKDDEYRERGGFYHLVNLGLERSGKGFWIFDEFSARAALNLDLSSTYRKNVGVGNVDNLDEKDYPSTSEGFTFNTGIGVRRGIGSLDLAVVLSNWEGSFLGPQAASATFTIDFAHQKSGSSTSSSSQSSSSDTDDDLGL